MHFKSSAQKAATNGTMDGHEAEYSVGSLVMVHHDY
jgi:hypothetical protein